MTQVFGDYLPTRILSLSSAMAKGKGEQKEQTEQARVARTEEEFEQIAKEASASEHEQTHPPYRPLRQGEEIPSMQELWAYASRRYGRFQGYAFASALAVGASIFMLASFTRRTKRAE